jgi:uncharacterized membrane protein
MLAYIDYAFIVVFFVVLLGLILWTTSPRKAEAVATSFQAEALPPPRENKLAYSFLVGLLVLFFVLTILDQRQHAHAGS